IVIANIRRCWRWGGWGGACRETNQQSRDQDYFDHFPSSLYIVVRMRSLRKSVSNRAILGYQVYCRRRVTLTRFLILCAETTLARKLMQNQGFLVQSHPELRASENARRETIPMRGLLRRVRRSRPRSEAKAPPTARNRPQLPPAF